MDQAKLQATAAQIQDELNQAVSGFKSRGWEHFKKVLVVAFVLAGVGYAVLFRTTAAQVKAIKVKVNQLRDVSKYAVEYRDDKMRLAGLKDKFPTEAEHKDWIFNLVLTSAKENGIAIDSISSQKEEDRTDVPFIKLSIDVVGKGTYHQVGAWVARLEGTGKFTQVENFALTKARESNPDAPPSGLTSAQLTLATVIPKGMEGL